MKFNFKIQQYQTDAVDAVVKVFKEQGFHDKVSFIRDLGKVTEPVQQQLSFVMQDDFGEVDDPSNDTGYKNELIELSDDQLLHNIQELQSQNNIKLSPSLVKDMYTSRLCSSLIKDMVGVSLLSLYRVLLFVRVSRNPLKLPPTTLWNTTVKRLVSSCITVLTLINSTASLPARESM